MTGLMQGELAQKRAEDLHGVDEVAATWRHLRCIRGNPWSSVTGEPEPPTAMLSCTPSSPGIDVVEKPGID